MRLILASTSRYRAELLGRLRIPFEGVAPKVDETPGTREVAPKLAARLALAKARSVALRHPHAWVLGSDQVATVQGRLLGKPGTADAIREQLALLSGQSAIFTTAVALVSSDSPRALASLDVTTVRFRRLAPAEIERYAAAEPAPDCAGGFKVEGLGISLFEEVQSTDPTGLVGLPLIATRRLLARAGFQIP